jgi:FkbM family methyltransferase
LRPGDVFVDVGANVGYFSLIGSRCVGPEGVVVAIEASPRMFELLRRNLWRNRLTNVRAVNVAASDAHGSLRIYEGPAWNRGQATTVGPNGGSPGSRVRAMPIGEILSEAEVRRARVVKIDVEGGEPAVVSGLLACLPAMRADLEIVVEIVPEFLVAQGRSPDALVEAFQSRGYRTYKLEVDYTAASYVAKPLAGPIEWHGGFGGQADYIFSRGDPAAGAFHRTSVQRRRPRAGSRRSRLTGKR